MPIGGVLPEPIPRLKPVEVYYDYGNLVIALSRNGLEERGYYFQWGWSSESPVGSKKWNVKLINGAETANPGVVYEYRRKL